MTSSRHLPVAAACALFLSLPALHARAEPDKDDPAAELASFRLPPGFEANLFASEKDGVVKPIQMRSMGNDRSGGSFCGGGWRTPV